MDPEGFMRALGKFPVAGASVSRSAVGNLWKWQDSGSDCSWASSAYLQHWNNSLVYGWWWWSSSIMMQMMKAEWWWWEICAKSNHTHVGAHFRAHSVAELMTKKGVSSSTSVSVEYHWDTMKWVINAGPCRGRYSIHIGLQDFICRGVLMWKRSFHPRTTPSQPSLNYCNTFYMGLSLKIIWKLLLVQNASAWMLTSTRYSDYNAPGVWHLCWLPMFSWLQWNVRLLKVKTSEDIRPGYL